MTPLPCPRAGKWIRGCRFEARYSTGPARRLTEGELSNLLYGDTTDALRAVRANHYICDLCVTCGKTIERPAATSEGGKDEIQVAPTA